MTTTINSKGQVVIPAGIRLRQGFFPGDKLMLEEHGGEIVLKKAQRSRRKSLVQWMLNCPVADFRIVRLKDLPRGVKL